MKNAHPKIAKLLLASALLLGFQLPADNVVRGQQLSLDSCLALARRNNVDIRTSKLEIERAQEVKKQVYTKYFPQANLSGLGYIAASPIVRFGINDVSSADMRELLQALYELVSEDSDIKNELDLMENGMAASAIVAQPIYAGGRIVTGNKLASLGVEASKLKAEMTQRDMEENIESSFYLVTSLQEKVSTVESALALIDSLDRTVQSALANGLVTRADALQIQLKRNEMLAMQQKLVSGIRLSKRLLCQQIGIDYSDNIIFSEENATLALPPLEYTHRNVADSLRPEVQLLRLSVEAERLQKRLTLGEALPQVAVVGIATYGNLMRREASANAIALLSVSIPLTSWWETSHKMKEHNLRIQEAQLRQDHLNHMMSIEEEKVYSDMVDAFLLMKSDSSALDIARENYRIANLNYSAGNATLNDVLQAHTLLLQAQNAITDRRTTFLVARRRLNDLHK